mmetsp:Transcript_76798/g.248592  ORF Transcript_76798/g.248592 Transcript_76798/m.248592 type:complete len:234 (-) Transcript_76798:436-1137(-)
MPRHRQGERITGPGVPHRDATVCVARHDDAGAQVRPSARHGATGRDGPQCLPSLQVPKLHRPVGARREGLGAAPEKAASSEGAEVATERVQQALCTQVQQPKGMVGRGCQEQARAWREVHGHQPRQVSGDGEVGVQSGRFAVQELHIAVGGADGHKGARQRGLLHASRGDASKLGSVDLAEDMLRHRKCRHLDSRPVDAALLPDELHLAQILQLNQEPVCLGRLGLQLLLHTL